MPGTRRVELRNMVMPEPVRTQVLRFLAQLNAAECGQAIQMVRQRAEGFVLGLETASFHKEITEALYIGFENAAEERLAQIKTW